jgi:ABC-type multidrug transport system ATPase subunit
MEALTTVGLWKLADTPISQLSSGQRTRLRLATAVVCRPSVACLDEPTADLDSDGRAAATKVVMELAARGSAVLVASHDDGFLAGLADASLCLRRGRLQAPPVGRPAHSLERRGGRQSLRRSTKGRPSRASALRLVETA